jgi:hypothetical protein
LVSSTNISRTGWITARFAWRDLQVINTAEGSEAPADSFSQVDLARTFSTDGTADDATGLGLHRMAMLGSADAQPLLHRRVEVADGDTAHWDGVACAMCLHYYQCLHCRQFRDDECSSSRPCATIMAHRSSQRALKRWLADRQQPGYATGQ